MESIDFYFQMMFGLYSYMTFKIRREILKPNGGVYCNHCGQELWEHDTLGSFEFDRLLKRVRPMNSNVADEVDTYGQEYLYRLLVPTFNDIQIMRGK